MMYFNSNDINLKFEYPSIIKSIKNAFKKIKEVIYDAVNKIVSNECFIDELIIEIKDYFNSMENILEQFIEIFEEEYYYFTSIKSMLFYILDNKESFNYLEYVINLFLSFYDLIQLKSSDSSEYKIKQNSFDLEIDSFEQKFYTEICKPSEYYDETVLSSITNSLLNL